MCGRIAQHRAEVAYLKWLHTSGRVARPPDETNIERYNVPPSTQVRLLHLDDDGLRFDPMRWGYLPFWAIGKSKRPPAINARTESLASTSFWREAKKHGRALVPADGWFEWVKHPTNKKLKQPYFIQQKSKEPMLFAAVGRFARGEEAQPDEAGFAIVTHHSDAGMVDIHDRRPVVLPADVAMEWMDQATPAEQASDLIRHHAVEVEDFEWYPVSPEVGKVSNQGPHLIVPLDKPAF